MHLAGDVDGRSPRARNPSPRVAAGQWGVVHGVAVDYPGVVADGNAAPYRGILHVGEFSPIYIGRGHFQHSPIIGLITRFHVEFVLEGQHGLIGP